MKFLNWFRKQAPSLGTFGSTHHNRQKEVGDLQGLAKAFKSVEGLSSWLLRLTQEVEVLKTMLREKGLWDEAQYKKAITDRMIDDHNSTGGNSWQYHSYYPYILNEPGFLRDRFKASDEEILAFKNTVDEVSSYT